MNVLTLGLAGLGLAVGAGLALYAVHRAPALTSSTGPVGGAPTGHGEWDRVLFATGDLDGG